MSKCIVKILRDETPGGLAEKINKELEENTRSWDTVTGIKYQVAVIPIMRGKEIAGFKTEYSALIPGVMNLESEELNMEKIPEWIYAPTNFSPELEKTFAAVEKALGFKLFIWQKTFIANTTYRRSGRTTAEILRALLNVSKPPLDYTKPVADHMERFYREETREIKAKLDAAGIPTRTVFFSRQEKQKYYSEAETGKQEKNTIPEFTPEYGKRIWL